MVKPIVFEDSDDKFLTGVETFVGVVGKMNMKSSGVTRVRIATGSPMLPLSRLMTRSFFPHLLRVFKALRLRAVLFQGEVLLTMWIIFFEFTLRSANDDVLASPSELLYVRAMVGKRH